MEKVIIGKIVNTHGIKGELKIENRTDFSDVRFEKGATIFIDDQTFTVATHRVHKGYDLVSLEGYQDINKVEHLKGQLVYVLKDEELLEEGEYYIDDLIDCEVYNNDELIGPVIDVYDNTYQSILHVDNNGQKVLIPYVEAFIKEIDIDGKRIDVSLIEGFINDED